MANVPIVTEVTKAQLDALVAANGLNEGLQYKVTDKNWLLIANSNNTLLPIINVLNLHINDLIPSYIDTNNITIQTDFVTGNHNLPENLFYIPIPNGFYPISIMVDNQSDSAQEISLEQDMPISEPIIFQLGKSNHQFTKATLESTELSNYNLVTYGYSSGDGQVGLSFLLRCAKF